VGHFVVSHEGGKSAGSWFDNGLVANLVVVTTATANAGILRFARG
jgi:hypothetical protein